MEQVWDNIVNAGHDFIANVGAAFDRFVKDEFIQNIAFIVFVVVVAIVTPQLALSAGIATLIQASATGDYSFNNIRNSFYRNYATSFAFGYLTNTMSDPISLGSSLFAIGSNVTTNLYINDEGFRTRLNDSINNAIRDVLSRIAKPPKPERY